MNKAGGQVKRDQMTKMCLWTERQRALELRWEAKIHAVEQAPLKWVQQRGATRREEMALEEGGEKDEILNTHIFQSGSSIIQGYNSCCFKAWGIITKEVA